MLRRRVLRVNRMHRRLCSSTKWADTVAQRLPLVLDRTALGDDVLEIGPGYGATTRVLAKRIKHLTALEVDEMSAARLSRQGIRIVHGSGTDMPLRDNGFSGVVCFTMLHHVPSPALQDELFTEAHRVLAPGGVFASSDSQPNARFRLLHVGDTMTVVPAATLPDRLEAAGFTDIQVEHEPKHIVRFWARKPQTV
jgi:SAM-dependent methyltransferase